MACSTGCLNSWLNLNHLTNPHHCSGILRGLSRRKDKASIASRYLVFSSGAVAWSAQLLLESSDNVCFMYFLSCICVFFHSKYFICNITMYRVKGWDNCTYNLTNYYAVLLRDLCKVCYKPNFVSTGHMRCNKTCWQCLHIMFSVP